MIKAAIYGASGYTGLELLRILAAHPDVKVVCATSRQTKGALVEDVFPALRGGYTGLVMTDVEDPGACGADVVFCCLPHGASQTIVKKSVASGRKTIDLSADFRLKDPALYAKWYGEHSCPELLAGAVYGLPELFREKIKGAALIANPGCYPTGAALALAPLIKAGMFEQGSIIIDSKSGASGAGRGASVEQLFCEVSGGFRAYKVGSHRHTPEIDQTLGALSGRVESVTFTPHLLPVSRGILTTAYVGVKGVADAATLHKRYEEFYSGEKFVRVLGHGKSPDIASVRGSNYCDIGVFHDAGKKRAVVISAIDNLVKGASGQAVQNMNIVCGFSEDAGLGAIPLSV